MKAEFIIVLVVAGGIGLVGVRVLAAEAALQITVLAHQPLAFLQEFPKLRPEFLVVAGIKQQLPSFRRVTQAFFDLVQFTMERRRHFGVQSFSVFRCFVCSRDGRGWNLLPSRRSVFQASIGGAGRCGVTGRRWASGIL